MKPRPSPGDGGNGQSQGEAEDCQRRTRVDESDGEKFYHFCGCSNDPGRVPDCCQVILVKSGNRAWAPEAIGDCKPATPTCPDRGEECVVLGPASQKAAVCFD